MQKIPEMKMAEIKWILGMNASFYYYYIYMYYSMHLLNNYKGNTEGY